MYIFYLFCLNSSPCNTRALPGPVHEFVPWLMSPTLVGRFLHLTRYVEAQNFCLSMIWDVHDPHWCVPWTDRYCLWFSDVYFRPWRPWRPFVAFQCLLYLRNVCWWCYKYRHIIRIGYNCCLDATGIEPGPPGRGSGILATRPYQTTLRILVVFGDYTFFIFHLFGLGNEVLRQLHLHTLLASQRVTVVDFRNSVNLGTRWCSWLRHCATSRKVAASIPDDVGIFRWSNPPGRSMALGSTQSLTEMSTRGISCGVKAAGA